MLRYLPGRSLKARGRSFKKMSIDAMNQNDREMNDGRTYSDKLHGLLNPGGKRGCRNQTKKNDLQPDVQQTEQKAVSGFFRSLITAHDPARR